MDMGRILIAIFVLALGAAEGARILGVFPAPSVSHQFVYRHLTQELQSRGHDLTIITPDPIGNHSLERYREIDVSKVYDYWATRFDMAAESNEILRWVPELFMLVMIGAIHDICEIYLSDPNVVALQNEEFDLLIMEWGMAPCMYPLYLRCNKNMIGVLSLTMGSLSHIALGSTSNPTYTPEMFFSYTDHMSFLQRARNAFFHAMASIHFVVSLWDQTNVARKYFGEETPSLFEIVKDVRVVLTNTHPSVFYPRPMAQNAIPIGGSPFHLEGRVNKTLPKVSVHKLLAVP